MSRVRKLLLAAALLSGAVSRGAIAADDASARPAPSKSGKRKTPPRKAEPPIEVPPEEPTPEAAQLHHDVAQEHYEAAHYQKALGEFEIADRYKSTPARKMGIARCLEKLGRIPEAIEYYKLVARRSPDPFDVDEAKRRIKELTPKPKVEEMGSDPFAEGDPPKKPEEATPPPPDPPPTKKAPSRGARAR